MSKNVKKKMLLNAQKCQKGFTKKKNKKKSEKCGQTGHQSPMVTQRPWKLGSIGFLLKPIFLG